MVSMDPGLCGHCVHCQTIDGARTQFYLCRLSATDPRFPRYPPIPVRRAPDTSRASPGISIGTEGRQRMAFALPARVRYTRLMQNARLKMMVALVAAVAIGCGNSPSAAQSPSPPPAPPAAAGAADPVVAEVGGRKITLAEVDAKWQEFDAAERARLTQLLYQNRRNMLDLVVGDALIADAAKAANMSVAAYTEREIGRRLKVPSEADLRSFYEANKERAQGRSFEELRKPIEDFLASQRQGQARAQLVDELRNKAGNVRVMLEPPRVEVAIASTDPTSGPDAAPVTIVEYSDYQ